MHVNRQSENGSARLAVLLVLIVALVASLFILPVKSYLVGVLEWTQGLGFWGPVFVSLFYVVACVLFLPGSILTLGAGFLFGLWTGFLAAWIGANLGAAVAFLLGRSIAREWIASRVAANPRFAAIDEAVGREGFKIVVLLRLSPVFPFNLLNYALGLTKVSFSSYVLASLIGMIPGGLMYVYLGIAARDLASIAAGKVEGGSGQQAFLWAGLIATIVVVTFVTRIAGKSLREAEAARGDSRVASDSDPQPAPDIDRSTEVLPDDIHNRELVAYVRPGGRVNPVPAQKYNLVVLGAGTAGLVTAAGAAGLGAKVALVERHLLGGDCLNVGCVPSKSIIRSSRAAGEIRRARELGIEVPDGVRADFAAVMERMRSIRARIGRHDSVQRFTDLGVDVFLGNGRFTGPQSVDVAGKELRFHKAVIATGARPMRPAIKGLNEAGFLTNETVFSLTQLPEKLAVIGGGPIGCELAQAFQRLGSRVTLFHRKDHILDREDPDAARIVQDRFIKDGMVLLLGSTLHEAEVRDGLKVIHYAQGGRRDSVAVNEILVGVGRVPNVEHLDLELAGVEYNSRDGVLVNDFLQTSNPRIYAAGDICMRHKFTHAADAAARIVIQNALFFKSKRVSALNIPWVTYTSPEIAHVGMYERDARKQGLGVDTFVRYFKDVDRSVADGEEDGLVKIHVQKGKDRILGATMVSPHAGETISEITVAMAGKLGLAAIAGVIHPYPTQAEAIKQAADAYNRSRLTPLLKNVFHRWFAWRRR